MHQMHIDASEFTYLYINVSYNDWQEFKSSGKAFEGDELNREDIIKWYSDQVSKRLDGVNVSFRHYCFVEKPPIINYFSPMKRVVLKIRIPSSLVVLFDDNFYVLVLNSLYNRSHMYLAFNEREDAEKADCTIEECHASYERMFDLDSDKRCKNWAGDIQLRAFIPYLTRSMIRKVWVYHWDRRLRKKRKTGK